MFRSRLLVQLSDLPWLVVAGAFGLLLELGLRLGGVVPPNAWWLIPVRGALAAGGICGWLAFRFNRRVAGPVLGAVAGGAIALVVPPLLDLVGPGGGLLSRSMLEPVLLAVAWGLLTPLTDLVVQRWLLGGPLGRLAAHHPRYAHLRPD